MTNVTMRKDGNRLVIEVDLAQTHGASASGKSVKVASTDGNASVPGTDFKVGLNVYKPVGK